MKEIGRFKVSNVSRVEKRNMWNRGVIWGIPVDVNVDEIKTNLKGGKVKDARRLTSFKNGVRQVSESLLLEFEDEMLPNKVSLGYMMYNVREYVPKPLRCFKCQRFGHTALNCKGKRRCARCGEDHDYEKCRRDMQPKCCGGNHSVAYGGCEVMKRQVEIQQVRVKNKISYAEAVRLVNHREEGVVNEASENLNNDQHEQIKGGKVLVDLRKFVIFIAGVINATTEAKSKTERIQIIVKAAVNHLSLNDLSWEEVRNELSAKASQEASFVG